MNRAIDKTQQIFCGFLSLYPNLDTIIRFSLYASLLNIFSRIFKDYEFLVDILPVCNQTLELFSVHIIWVMLRTRGSVGVQKALHNFYEFLEAIHFIKKNSSIILKLVKIVMA